MTTISVGVDIGGTNTVYGFVDKDGNELGEGHFPTDTEAPPEQLVDQLASAIKSDFMSLEKENLTLTGIGIGAPNANYHTGTINNPPNFNWEIVEFVQLVQRHFDLPVAITNDANAAAIGEMTFGAAQNMKDFIVITLGTGLGSGIVVNGRLVLGHDGFAGEMGHMVAELNSDRKCGCSKYGCLETFASATGIVRTAKRMLAEKNAESVLRLIESEHLTSKDIANAAQNDDPLALAAFDLTAKYLGLRIADAVTLTSPEAVFFFGGLANAGELLLAPTRKYMEQYLFPAFRGKVHLRTSGLQNRNVAILGAAALIRMEIEQTG